MSISGRTLRAGRCGVRLSHSLPMAGVSASAISRRAQSTTAEPMHMAAAARRLAASALLRPHPHAPRTSPSATPPRADHQPEAVPHGPGGQGGRREARVGDGVQGCVRVGAGAGARVPGASAAAVVGAIAVVLFRRVARGGRMAAASANERAFCATLTPPCRPQIHRHAHHAPQECSSRSTRT